MLNLHYTCVGLHGYSITCAFLIDSLNVLLNLVVHVYEINKCQQSG